MLQFRKKRSIFNLRKTEAPLIKVLTLCSPIIEGQARTFLQRFRQFRFSNQPFPDFEVKPVF